MKLTLTILSVTGLVAAQGYGYGNSSSSAGSSATTSANATPSATSSPKIPSNITTSCSNFLSALNSAPSIQGCVVPVLNALGNNNIDPMSSVCAVATSSSCSTSTMRSWLADFRGNCTEEVVRNPHQEVVATYSVMYTLMPFLNAACAKDVSGQYCLSQSAGNNTAKLSSGMATAAQAPLTDSNGYIVQEAFSTLNILFLGVNASMDATMLCTLCTKSMLTSYIQFESAIPSAIPSTQLTLLSSQSILWAAVQNKCPADFISGALANAGTSPNVANGASTSSPANAAMAVLTIVAAGVITM